MLSVPDIVGSLRRAALDVEALLLPMACLGCETVLPSRHGDGPLCDGCRMRLRPVSPPRCGRCGQTLDSWERTSGQTDKRTNCGFCRGWPDSLQWAASAVWLDDGPARDLVHALKYEGWRAAAQPMARAIMRHCGHLLSPDATLVPVPLGRTRQRERGHNQADVLARELAALSGLRVEHCLERSRETRTQTTLGTTERKRNVVDAFELSGVGCVSRQHLILIDDVLTTGATICAAAEALALAGCHPVGAISFARATNPS